MFGAFDISASALTAQRVRLDTISSNIANSEAVLGPDNKPMTYRRLYPVFKSQRADGGPGVSVAAIEKDFSPFIQKKEPGNLAADSNGNVNYPNVDVITEQVNALETTRAYEANVTAIETTKSMMSATLRVLA